MLKKHLSSRPGLSLVDTMVVESTVPSECNVEAERWETVMRECDDIDMADFTDLIVAEM